MSRSIHTTRRKLEEARRQHEAPEEIAGLEASLTRKRDIKQFVYDERRAIVHADNLGAACGVPIRQVIDHQYVHFPASPSDLSTLLQDLPADAFSGVCEIILDSHVRNKTAVLNAYDDVDPWFAAPGHQILPGVWTGDILGSYFPDRSSIVLYAYHFEPATPGIENWGVLLRLWALETFLHELAHHYDHTRRTARGRWLADDTAKNEDFAEQAAYAWTMQFAVPFIERTCPKEVDTLRRWTLRYGGTQIALGAFVRRPNSIQNAFPPRDAVSRLIEEIHAGSSLTCCRLVFAEYLHFAELYDEALKSIQTVLSEEPDNGEALTLKADIFVHQERYAEAKAIADPLIATAGATERLCRVLMDIYEGLGDWGRIIETANLALALPQDNEWDRIDALRHRARANLRSGKTSEAKTDIGELEAFESRRPTRFGGRQIQLLRQELDGIDASR